MIFNQKKKVAVRGLTVFLVFWIPPAGYLARQPNILNFPDFTQSLHVNAGGSILHQVTTAVINAALHHSQPSSYPAEKNSYIPTVTPSTYLQTILHYEKQRSVVWQNFMTFRNNLIHLRGSHTHTHTRTLQVIPKQ
jgi:hypothetical protein